MKFREIILKSGTKIFLGRNAKNNDELVGLYKGKENLIFHTAAPGSAFCVIEKIKPSKKDINEAGAVCAFYSQDWRDNKTDIKLHLFSGKQIKKPFFAKTGTWKITKKPKVITIKKIDIKKCQQQ